VRRRALLGGCVQACACEEQLLPAGACEGELLGCCCAKGSSVAVCCCAAREAARGAERAGELCCGQH
jgi:hypothetical protein